MDTPPFRFTEAHYLAQKDRTPSNDYKTFLRFIGSFVDGAVESEQYEELIGLEKAQEYLKDEEKYHHDLPTKEMRYAFFRDCFRKTLVPVRGEMGTNSDDPPVEKEYKRFKDLVGRYVDDMESQERFEQLQGFEKAIEYLNHKEVFLDELNDDVKRRNYLTDVFSIVNEATLEEDHEAFRRNFNYKPQEHPPEADESGVRSKLTKALESIDEFRNQYPNRNTRLKHIKEVDDRLQENFQSIQKALGLSEYERFSDIHQIEDDLRESRKSPPSGFER